MSHLNVAVSDNDIAAVKYMIKVGLPTSVEIYEALRLAASRGHMEIVECICDTCDVKLLLNGPLLEAAKHGHLDVVKFLYDRGAQLNTHGCGAIRVAVFNGHTHVVKFLIDNGAEYIFENDVLLRSAAELGDVMCVELLLHYM